MKLPGLYVELFTALFVFNNGVLYYSNLYALAARSSPCLVTQIYNNNNTKKLIVSILHVFQKKSIQTSSNNFYY